MSAGPCDGPHAEHARVGCADSGAVGWVAAHNTGADWGGLLATVGALAAPAQHGLDRSATAAAPPAGAEVAVRRVVQELVVDMSGFPSFVQCGVVVRSSSPRR